MRTQDSRGGPLVLGFDVGGTSSRAMVADLAGTVLGTGRAGGGNPNSHPPDRAVEQVARAGRTALADVDPGTVRAGILGMAGTSKLTDPAVAALFDEAWRALGLDCPVQVVSDAEVAFAAATTAPAGTVLVAGTGAIAARISDHRLTTTSGGYGWLLGDEGSGFWLGREAVRETLRALDRGERDGSPLVTAVHLRLLSSASRAAEPDGLVRKRLITAVHAEPPVRLAELASVVTGAARDGDPIAADIVHRAATFLVDTAETTRGGNDTTPVVLAGSLIDGDGPVARAVRDELALRGHVRPAAAGPGEAGAAWLAALEVAGDATDTGRLHSRYLAARPVPQA